MPLPQSLSSLTPGERVSLTPGPDPKEKIKATSGAPVLDASEVIDDPYFKGLQLPDKHKVLMQDPHYKSMDPKEQAKFLNSVHYGEGRTQDEQDQRTKSATAKEVVKNYSYVLPMAGTFIGAGLGSALPGPGTVVGGALGTAAGETARQAVIHKIFPDEPSPVSKEGLEQTAIWGTLGAASELPGAIARGYGNVVLDWLAGAKDPREVGDVIKAFNDSHPFAITRQGLQDSIEGANKELSKKLTPIYRMTSTPSDIDALLQPIRAQARAEDAPFARMGAKGKPTSIARVSNTVNDIIAGAKSRAGIKGSTATVQQLANFQREVQKMAFESAQADPTVGGVAHKIMQDAYSTVGKEVDRLAPPARPILNRMMNNHAAISALENYKPGPIKSAAVTAATHPVTSRVLSPAAAPAAVIGGRKVYQGIKSIGELIP